MGRESATKQVGRFNVRITLMYLTSEGMMDTEVINCRNWTHSNNFLVLELFTNMLRVVCLTQYYGFTVEVLDLTDLQRLESSNN